MTLHQAGEARGGKKKKNNFTDVALNIQRKSGELV